MEAEASGRLLPSPITVDRDDLGASVPEDHRRQSRTRPDVGDAGSLQGGARDVLDRVEQFRRVRRTVRGVAGGDPVERAGLRSRSIGHARILPARPRYPWWCPDIPEEPFAEPEEPLPEEPDEPDEPDPFAAAPA